MHFSMIISLFALFASIGCDKPSVSTEVLPQIVSGNGIIRGEVKFSGPTPVMNLISATEACCKTDPPLTEENTIINSNGTLRNVFVYLENAPATDGSTQPPALLDQVHCRYVPHAIGVQVGQPLRIRSSDPTMHNVHFNPQKNPAQIWR